MRHAQRQRLAGLALVAVILITAVGCTPSNEDRLSALEAEVAALKQGNTASREELARVRKNLEAIQDLLKLDRDRAQLKEGEETAPLSDEELDAKAKNFVDKNLDRLMEVTKKLLDKMEKELDEQLDKMKEPTPPQGDEI